MSEKNSVLKFIIPFEKGHVNIVKSVHKSVHESKKSCPQKCPQLKIREKIIYTR